MSYGKSDDLVTIYNNMTSLAGKTSLYDMVSMVIPGYLFIQCVQFASRIIIQFDSDITAAVVMFTLSWIVGLILHLASKDIFDIILRNKIKDLEDVNEDVSKSNEKRYNCRDKENKRVIFDYYLKYYRQMPGYTKSVVPILEAQVAFLRSILLVILSFEYAIIISTQSSPHESSYDSVVQYIILIAIIIGVLWGISKYFQNALNVWWSVVLLLFIVCPILLLSCLRKDVEAMEQSTLLPINLIFYFLLLLEVVIFFLIYYRQRAIYERIFEDDYYTKLVKRLNNLL